jgi:putative FmdB family regulatory protein
VALYDFVCNQCDHDFEVFSTGFIKDEQKKCPECGSADVQQKFTSFLRGGSSSSSHVPSGGCAAPAGSGFG